MPLNAKTLRRTLLVLAVLLVAAVGGVIGYRQWRKLKLMGEIAGILKRGLGHQLCDGCSYSQNIRGHLAFRLHWRKGEESSPGHFTLHDAQITLFSPDGKRQDVIYGSEFEYDQKAEIVRSEGEVQMDLQAPESMERKPASGAAPKPPAPIHVRTSGLVYQRKLGLAATDKAVEIQYDGLVCTAIGADLDNNTDLVRLLHEVHVTGALHGRPGTLDAESVAMNRESNQLDLTSPRAVSADRHARAQHALVFLRKDGSVDHGFAEGAVELTSAMPGGSRVGSRVVDAPRMEITANRDNVVQTARLLGGVTMVGTEPAKPMHGQAQRADLRFNKAGRLEDLVADGHASLHAEDLVNGRTVCDLRGDRIHASFSTPPNPKSQTLLSAMEAHGSAVVRMDQQMKVEAQAAPARRISEMHGDELRTTFAPEMVASREMASLRTVDARGHTALDQQDTTGARSSSTGDQLQATFVAGDQGRGEELVSAVQTGHVQMAGLTVSKPMVGKPAKAPEAWRGSAGRAFLDGRTEVLTLTAEGDSASAHMEDSQSRIDAREVRLHRLTGDGEAAGDVRATLVGSPDASAKPGQPAAATQLTHVEADRARMIHALNRGEFDGSAAHPARLWQQASRVEAAHLVVDRDRKTLVARPEGTSDWVRADFADAGGSAPKVQTSSGAAAGPPGGSPFGGRRVKSPEMQPDLPQAGGAVRVVAAKMDYSETTRQALFSGGPRGRLQMQFAGGESTAERGVVFLASPGGAKAAASGIGGSLERAVLLGSVELRQPERTATSDQLTYTAAGDRFVLSADPGKTVHADDRRQGNVTGSVLTFSKAESSIVVAGEPGASRQRGGRVRTELELKP